MTKAIMQFCADTTMVCITLLIVTFALFLAGFLARVSYLEIKSWWRR